jgi:glycolate oxidase
VTAPFLEVLAATIPDLRLSTDGVDLAAHRRDETAYLEPPLPLAVAFPASTAEVAAIARAASAHGVPLVPRGAGTGLAGGANAVAGGLVVSLVRMNRVLEIDQENRVVVVQPGVVNADLNMAVAARGLHFAPDPASYETGRVW